MEVVVPQTPANARSVTLRALGLTEGADDHALVAASIRRAASLRCPSSRSSISASVKQAIAPIASPDPELVDDVIEALLSSGDLTEAAIADDGSRPGTSIYLGAPRFIRTRSGEAILIGIRPDAATIVGEALSDRLRIVGHLRVLPSVSETDIELLAAYGLEEIDETRWMRHEDPCQASDLVDIYMNRLARQPQSGEVDELRILDPQAPARYYRGRWRTPTDDTGAFLARRPQRYGAELWCVVELQAGRCIRLLDLPLIGRHRACDEAWRLQAAIDANHGSPQQVLVQSTGRGLVRLGLPQPPPRWLQRRWDLVAQPSTLKLGIIAYEFAAEHIRPEVAFLKDHLWMTTKLVETEQ